MSNNMNRKEAMNELFDSTLITLGAVVLECLHEKQLVMVFPLQHL